MSYSETRTQDDRSRGELIRLRQRRTRCSAGLTQRLGGGVVAKLGDECDGSMCARSTRVPTFPEKTERERERERVEGSGIRVRTAIMVSSLDPLPAYYFPYEVAVSASSFPHLCLLTAALGLFFAACFLSLLVVSNRSSPSLAGILKELLLALLTALFLGFALFFLCLIVGIYV